MQYKKLKKALSVAMLSVFAVSTFSTTTYGLDVDTKTEKTEGIRAEEAEGTLERKIVGYFPEWAYKSKEHNYFNVTDLQWEDLTHIQYSFAMVDEATNKVAFGDKFAATEETFDGMDLSYNGEKITLDESLPYKGHFNLLQQMKKKYNDVDLLISIGGWAGSRGFYTMMDTNEGINTFTDSCVEFIRDYGFDGVDIDFEFPSSTSMSGNPDDFDVSEPRRKTINARYNLMMKTLREKLDKASTEDGKDYLLTAAVSGSSWVLGGVESNEFAKYLDFLSIMSYDYHGGWNEFVENQANIYPDKEDKETMNMIMPVLGMDWSYKYYRGVLPPEKILMGIPYYTRGWENVQGGNGTGLHGTSKTPATGKYNIWGDLDANGNQIPAGANPLWHVLNLMEQDENLKVHWDPVGKVPYIWQNNEKVFLTFENEKSIDERLKYIEEKNLGGALIWVMDGDYDLNPNYVEGSTDINEGKYITGNTLTNRLRDGLDAMGDADKTIEGNQNLKPIAVDVKASGTYDHPNYTYDFKVTNNTTEEIKGGWEISFDLPKSAVFKSTWGGTVTQKENGDFTNITIKSSGWQNLAPGETTNLQGMIGLCFGGIRNVTFNGMNPVGGNGGGEIIPPPVDPPVNPEPPVEPPVEPPTPENNTAPVINGAVNKEIIVGDSFDKLSGVTALDKEDGDLTKNIKVTGDVDTSKAGKYTLIYKVTDSKGLETTLTRIITVKEKTNPSDDTFEFGKVYLAGDKVIYNGKNYQAKWWIQGEAPDKSLAWELIIEANPDGSVDYIEGKAYVGGDIVMYNGKKFKAKWWTTTLPGTDESWEELK